jgi:hypothetical protein
MFKDNLTGGFNPSDTLPAKKFPKIIAVRRAKPEVQFVTLFIFCANESELPPT